MRPRRSLAAALLLASALAPFSSEAQRGPYVHGQPLPPPPALGAEAVARVVRESAAGMRACFESALRADPALQTRVEEVRFTVLPSGRVGQVWLRLRPPSPALEGCLRAVVLRFSFSPHEGGPLEYRYAPNIDPA